MNTDMTYVNVGRSGLMVSRIGLGCMSLGLVAKGWILDEERSTAILDRAIDLGITLFDTANMYGEGASEEFLGRVLWKRLPREQAVLASKVFYPMRPDANGRGLSRKAIMSEIEGSLRRLRTDYIDLYQIHRWDNATPIEETLEALTDLVRTGKVRYIGASMMCAWQLCKALYISKLHGWSRFISMQPRYNLISREIEHEMLPLCVDQGVGVLPYSPLARGRLARSWDQRKATIRAESDKEGKLYDATEQDDRAVIDSVTAVADARGLPRAHVAIAWLLHKPGITAPLVGATKPEQLDDAVSAQSLRLTDEEVRDLERAYAPHPWII